MYSDSQTLTRWKKLTKQASLITSNVSWLLRFKKEKRTHCVIPNRASWTTI